MLLLLTCLHNILAQTSHFNYDPFPSYGQLSSVIFTILGTLTIDLCPWYSWKMYAVL